MRSDIEFKSEGLTLRGWLYKPAKGKGPFPTVVMAHGFSGVKEMGLDEYAEVFCKAGMAVLVYDNRCLGESDGKPRSDIDPVMQMRDYRSAITFAQSRKECDSNRIGIWGTSYTGGTVCAVAALDRRVKAVVSQVPFMNGVRNLQQFLPVVNMKGFRQMLDEDRQRRVEGKPSQYMKMCTLDPSEPHLFPGEQTYNFIHRYVGKGKKSTWENRVTLRSIDYMLEYDVSGYMKLISPTPLLMIVSEFDTCTPTDIALDHFNMVPGPKKLHIIDSDHYEAYVEKFDETSAAARDFFVENL
ncbi:MAG: acetylxylan esterase [Proteobacteria bacterium]|jgi:cephalosporin-C deacetylase-like acetyl esterase|nr:acetylxylan esterase [Pseudomonadota bacterium]MBK8959350.1 acetylxylan esterase [Pseudomonadota bacterium]